MSAPIVTELFSNGSISAIEYRCRAGLRAAPEVEVHRKYSLAFVRKGSFGYRVGGERHELVAGSLLLGAPGIEYVCTHDHACGDECISFSYAPDRLDDIGLLEAGSAAPMGQTRVLGVLVQAIFDGESDVGIDEVAIELAMRAKRIAPREATPIERKRAVRAVELIEARAHEELDLETVAADANVSPFHFLRAFKRVVGVTPHQYLVQTRISRAARLLRGDLSIAQIALEVGFGDLSGFNRAFRRAAGVTPREFRRKIVRDRPALGA